VHVDGARLAWVGEAPHILQQLVPRQDHARLPAERLEESELLGAKCDRAVADKDFMTRRVDAQVPNAQHSAAAGHAGSASEDGAHARHKLARIERFGEVVIHARVEARDPLGVLRARGERDHRCVRACPQLAQKIDPVRVRKPEVEHDQCGLHFVEKSARSRAGRRVLDDVARVAQVQRDQLRDRRVVLDDDDPRGSAHHVSVAIGRLIRQ
jgi:hypothetical protein